jgi:hypothetical protein
VNGAVVYLWKVGTSVSTATTSSRPAIKCKVCGKTIIPIPGTSKQFVCGGVEGRKSECQKIRRHAREHMISIIEIERPAAGVAPIYLQSLPRIAFERRRPWIATATCWLPVRSLQSTERIGIHLRLRCLRMAP